MLGTFFSEGRLTMSLRSSTVTPQFDEGKRSGYTQDFSSDSQYYSQGYHSHHPTNAINTISNGLICRQSFRLLLEDMASEDINHSDREVPGSLTGPKRVD